MAVIIAGNSIVRFSAYFAIDDQIGIVDRNLSALNVIPGTAWSTAALFSQMAADALHTFFKIAVSTDATLLGYKIYQKQTGAPPLIDRDVTIAGVCNGGVGHLPTQNAALIRFSSSIGGSRGHGRMYLPFPYTAAVDAAGLLAVAYKTHVRDVGSAFTAGWIVPNAGVGGGSLTVYPCTTFTVGTPALAFRMSGSSPADGFATQKRRGFFGKPNSPFF